MANELTIVLTGTITPSLSFVEPADPVTRRSEYLAALDFYRQFAPVVFLENSGYQLQDDPAFQALSNVTPYKLPPSCLPERGKGYQEFEMLERWMRECGNLPARFMKVTGRYLYLNFTTLLADCRAGWPAQMVIDLCPRSGRALSSLFCVETHFFGKRLRGLYRECDDRAGNWIERVLYRQLSAYPANVVRSFAVEPDLSAVCGSTGQALAVSRGKYAVKQALRRLNCAIDRQRLWYKP
jgi:hypothetical protein